MEADLFRLGRRVLAGFSLIAFAPWVFGFVLSAVPAVGATLGEAREPAGATGVETERRLAGSRWHLEVVGDVTTLSELRETRLDSPAPEIQAVVSQPWERSWKEEQSWLSLSRDLLRDENADLSLGLRLGSSVARFSAGNRELNFSESWRTKPALSLGFSLAGELRQGPRAGPFVRVRGGYVQARAGEDVETMSASRPGTSGDDRDASFAWSTLEVSFCLGWHWGSISPLAGVGYDLFTLKKRLDFHIPEPSNPASPEYETIRRLNAVPSFFEYRNESRWNPLLGLEWLLTDAWQMTASCTLRGFPEYRLAIRLSF